MWAADLATSTEVRARRFDAAGVPLDSLDAPRILASMPGPGWDPRAVVEGLPAGGWIVAWAQPGGGAGAGTVAFRFVRPDGTLEPAARADDAIVLATDPAVIPMPVPDGPVVASIVWTDASDPGAPVLRGRQIAATTHRLGTVTTLGGAERATGVATAGAALLVWSEVPAFGERPRVMGQRFGRTEDPAPIEIAPEGSEPAVAAAGDGFFVAWIGRGDDASGDVYVRRVPGSGALTEAPVRVTSTPRLPERSPSIAASGTGWVIAWQDGWTGEAVLTGGGGAVLPPEVASILAPELALHRGTNLSLARAASGGTWVVWSDLRTLGAITPARATMGLLLPPGGP